MLHLTRIKDFSLPQTCPFPCPHQGPIETRETRGRRWDHLRREGETELEERNSRVAADLIAAAAELSSQLCRKKRWGIEWGRSKGREGGTVSNSGRFWVRGLGVTTVGDWRGKGSTWRRGRVPSPRLHVVPRRRT